MPGTKNPRGCRGPGGSSRRVEGAFPQGHSRNFSVVLRLSMGPCTAASLTVGRGYCWGVDMQAVERVVEHWCRGRRWEGKLGIYGDLGGGIQCSTISRSGQQFTVTEVAEAATESSHLARGHWLLKMWRGQRQGMLPGYHAFRVELLPMPSGACYFPTP